MSGAETGALSLRFSLPAALRPEQFGGLPEQFRNVLLLPSRGRSQTRRAGGCAEPGYRAMLPSFLPRSTGVPRGISFARDPSCGNRLEFEAEGGPMNSEQEQRLQIVLEKLSRDNIRLTESADSVLRSAIDAISNEPYRRWPEFARSLEYRNTLQTNIIDLVEHFLRVIATYERTNTIEYFDISLHVPHFMRAFCEGDWIDPISHPIYTMR